MDPETVNSYILGIKAEIAPAAGCTEPAAAALCAAAAAQLLPDDPVSVELDVSEYILKNAMNVGIPGTGLTGLEVAAALGALCADPDKKLSVLSGISDEDKARARCMTSQNRVSVRLARDVPKIYVRAVVHGSSETAEAVIEDAHDNIVFLQRGDTVLADHRGPAGADGSEKDTQAQAGSLAGIWQFACSVDPARLEFLDELIRMNAGIAEEGLQHPYGMQTGRCIRKSCRSGLLADDVCNYAAAAAAAAADARMSGCDRCVMSVAGSGNQGLTATVPLIAAARKTGCPREKLLRALALSILTTVHAKRYIGRLSVLCGCSIAAAMGVCTAVVFLMDGTFRQAQQAVKTMVGDISGVVCDGAKPGCSLKISTAVHSAFLAAAMALSGCGADGRDGIVDDDAENSLENLGILGNTGMANANSTILDILLHKQALHEI